MQFRSGDCSDFSLINQNDLVRVLLRPYLNLRGKSDFEVHLPEA